MHLKILGEITGGINHKQSTSPANIAAIQHSPSIGEGGIAFFLKGINHDVVSEVDVTAVLVDSAAECLHDARNFVARSVDAEVVLVVQVTRAVTRPRVRHLVKRVR